LKARPTYPSVLSYPWTSNWSFSVMGTPCRGPTTRPFSVKNLSSSSARCNASSKRTSVRLGPVSVSYQMK
jgi:hypothetical protein